MEVAVVNLIELPKKDSRSIMTEEELLNVYAARGYQLVSVANGRAYMQMPPEPPPAPAPKARKAKEG
jgi:hypothetical protein